MDVDILNVKCDPVLSGSLRIQPGILPAYHMNKENWISILLDGTVDVKQIFTLLDMSFELTAKKSGSKASAVHNTNWIIPANPKYYDIETALTENPDEPFFWKQSNNIFVGDIVYIYLTAPVSSLLFKCRALEVDIPRQSENKNIRMKRAMRLKLLETYRHRTGQTERTRHLCGSGTAKHAKNIDRRDRLHGKRDAGEIMASHCDTRANSTPAKWKLWQV